tara:strand:- start:1602 stop:1925 length:324 start_codon:yes stop_codon:yes gene_type:complete
MNELRLTSEAAFAVYDKEGKMMTEIIAAEITDAEITELRSVAATDNRFYRYFENKVLVGILDALTAARREGERLSKENADLSADLAHAHAKIEELESDAEETPTRKA